MFSCLPSAICLVVKTVFSMDFILLLLCNKFLACNVHKTSKYFWIIGFGIEVPTSLVLFPYRSVLNIGHSKQFYVEIKVSEAIGICFFSVVVVSCNLICQGRFQRALLKI